MHRSISFILALLYLFCLITSDELQKENKYLIPLWINLSTIQSSLIFFFGKESTHRDNKSKSSRLFIDLIENETLLEESSNYNLTSIANIDQNKLQQFNINQGVLLQDKIVLTNFFELSNFTFKLIPKGIKALYRPSEGLLSLSRSPNSFLNQLYASGKIEHKIVSITKWSIDFGNISFTYGKDHVLNKSPLIDYQNKWAINLYSIIIGKISNLKFNCTNYIDYTQYDKQFTINLPFIMDTFNTQFIVLPYSYGREFYNKYFANESCLMVDTPDEISFECKCNPLDSEYITLIVEGVAVEMKYNNYEIRRDSNTQVCLFPITFKRSVDIAILGRKYVQEFNLVLNDEEKTIGFPEFIHSYSVGNYAIRVYEKKESEKRIAYFIGGIILLFGIIMLLGIKFVLFKSIN